MAREVHDGVVVRYVITSPLSLARLLWWYGEDDLWPRALDLAPEEVAALATAIAELRADPVEVSRRWPSAPRHDAPLLLPTIGLLEGASRPAVRRHRRPTAGMPGTLAVDDEKRWRDPQLEEVARLVDELAGSPRHWGDGPADRPRLQGRWAPW